jgi:tetratricopeptide (TPR) repeat protein
VFLSLLSFALLVPVAGAARVPADYRSVLGSDLAKEVGQLNESGRYRDAIRLAGRMHRSAGRLPALSYEAGYAHYRLGELEAAVRHYTAAIRLNPRLAMAWYDRGEIHLGEGRLEEARADFEQVVEIEPGHWVGHFRLAHMAGLEGDATSFETHLMAAIRAGFSFNSVLNDPDWKRFTMHADLQPVLRKIIVLYGNDDLLRWLGDRP